MSENDYKNEPWYSHLLLCAKFANDKEIRDACDGAVTELARLQAVVEKPMVYGPEAFRFHQFSDWVNKAQSRWPAHGLSGKNAVCLDTKGRICRIGSDFMQARDEEAFPVTVHPYRPAEAREQQ